MPTKKASPRTYHLNFRVEADVALSTSAATPEDALLKGRELEKDLGNFLQVDEVMDGGAELIGVWTID